MPDGTWAAQPTAAIEPARKALTCYSAELILSPGFLLSSRLGVRVPPCAPRSTAGKRPGLPLRAGAARALVGHSPAGGREPEVDVAVELGDGGRGEVLVVDEPDVVAEVPPFTTPQVNSQQRRELHESATQQ